MTRGRRGEEREKILRRKMRNIKVFAGCGCGCSCIAELFLLGRRNESKIRAVTPFIGFSRTHFSTFVLSRAIRIALN
jgi:hypothetical protein